MYSFKGFWKGFLLSMMYGGTPRFKIVMPVSAAVAILFVVNITFCC